MTDRPRHHLQKTAGYRASRAELSILDTDDIDELDPSVMALIDALARAQAAEDHRRETEASNDH